MERVQALGVFGRRVEDEPLGPDPSAGKLRQKRRTTSLPSAFGSPSEGGRRRYSGRSGPRKLKSIRESSQVLQQAPFRTGRFNYSQIMWIYSEFKALICFSSPPPPKEDIGLVGPVRGHGGQQRSLFPSQEVPITEEVEGGRTGWGVVWGSGVVYVRS